MDFGKLTPDQKATARMIADEARANNVDPELALAIGFRENRFLNRVNPDSGAMGVMQVMPANAGPLGMKIEDLNDPNMNIIAGIRILKENLDRYKGNAKLAAIAYNSRPVVADRYAKHGDDSLLPRETQNYWREVNNFRDLSINGYLPASADTQQPQQGEPNLGGQPEP
jgi:soluble lytic murein transglycosylase-like protein